MPDRKSVNENVKNNLRHLRKINDLRQEDVANALHLNDPSTYRSWEIGRACPKLNMIVQIANMYKVSVDEIVLSEDELKEKKENTAASIVANSNQYNENIYGDSYMGELDNFDKVILLKIHQLNKKDKQKLAEYIDSLVP